MYFSSIINDKILNAQTLSGGSIGRSFKLTTEASVYFAKYYQNKGLSEKEAHSLKEMQKCTQVKTPYIVAFNEHFLILEFIEATGTSPNYQSELGRMLATMHKVLRFDSFGFYEDNFIGSIPQINDYKKNWIDFFCQNRIGYQIKLSSDYDLMQMWKSLSVVIPHILEGTEEEPSLIHGDLWAGNIMKNNIGAPVLIDPAVYYAHREMELGMTKMFGGFTNCFYSAYNKVYPLKEGWEGRLDLYMLYHVLNHFNMFGGGYKNQALGIMKKYT